jgi:hypothetical protein
MASRPLDRLGNIIREGAPVDVAVPLFMLGQDTHMIFTVEKVSGGNVRLPDGSRTPGEIIVSTVMRIPYVDGQPVVGVLVLATPSPLGVKVESSLADAIKPS